MTIKISGLPPASPRELADQLDTIAGSILFELDVRFDVSLSLQYSTPGLPDFASRGREENKQPVAFPTIRYPKAATTLYRYAKSAAENPLLQYLAFYQAIEHFYPTFVERASISRIRNALRHPAFNRESDADIKRLIAQAESGGARAPKEGEQLRTTLEQCVEPSDVALWFDEMSDDIQRLLTASRQLNGVDALSFKPEHHKRLTDQIADRVYKLRNRIVHAKDSDDYVGPLLPYSAEARKLRADLLLIEFLCQNVIIAGSNETF